MTFLSVVHQKPRRPLSPATSIIGRRPAPVTRNIVATNTLRNDRNTNTKKRLSSQFARTTTTTTASLIFSPTVFIALDEDGELMVHHLDDETTPNKNTTRNNNNNAQNDNNTHKDALATALSPYHLMNIAMFPLVLEGDDELIHETTTTGNDHHDDNTEDEDDSCPSLSEGSSTTTTEDMPHERPSLPLLDESVGLIQQVVEGNNPKERASESTIAASHDNNNTAAAAAAAAAAGESAQEPSRTTITTTSRVETLHNNPLHLVMDNNNINNSSNNTSKHHEHAFLAPIVVNDEESATTQGRPRRRGRHSPTSVATIASNLSSDEGDKNNVEKEESMTTEHESSATLTVATDPTEDYRTSPAIEGHRCEQDGAASSSGDQRSGLEKDNDHHDASAETQLNAMKQEIQSLKEIIQGLKDEVNHLATDSQAVVAQREKTLGNLRKKRAELARVQEEKGKLELDLERVTLENRRLHDKNASLSAGIQKVSSVRDGLKTTLCLKNELHKELTKNVQTLQRSMKHMQATHDLEAELMESYRTLSRLTGFANMGKHIRELEKQLAKAVEQQKQQQQLDNQHD